jgi:hypothetical protein
MKNQLLLIADLPTESDSARTTTCSNKSTANELLGSKTRRTSGSPRNVDRAHKGVDAARQALRDAVQRATAREQQRREAREAALLAAITQPHLPHLGGTPGRRAA